MDVVVLVQRLAINSAEHEIYPAHIEFWDASNIACICIHA